MVKVGEGIEINIAENGDQFDADVGSLISILDSQTTS